MTFTVYIKKHLFGDIIVLLTISGTLYLLVSMWNNYTLEADPIVEMVPISDNTAEIVGSIFSSR